MYITLGEIFYLGSKVQTCLNRELNLVELVLMVLVHSSGPVLSQVQVQFEVLQMRSKKWTELNFGSPNLGQSCLISLHCGAHTW
jgi:hypothetical protein